MIGGFSIDGASRKATKFVTMPLFVAVANKASDVIDFTKHVSTDGSRMSATYLLAQKSQSCNRRNETHMLRYPVVGDLDDVDSIDRVKYTKDVVYDNLSCTLDQKKFLHVPHFSQSMESFDIRGILEACRFNKPLKGARYSSLWQENLAFLDCDDSGYEIIETWCASFMFFSCVMHTRWNMKHFYLYTPPEVIGRDTVPKRINLLEGWSYNIHSQTVKSAAYLIATVGGDAAEIFVSRMSIKRNVPVEVEDGEVFETNVSVPLFLCTTGVVTVSTVVMCITALLKWREHVVKHGLSGKNGFNGAMEVLMLAAEARREWGQCRRAASATVSSMSRRWRAG
ncbi:hypothetical protein FGB62_190g014 [Gracilaria domingensis]|nr:hypothetical protein FGB62_190g014 [Gracilaria domingensis]